MKIAMIGQKGVPATYGGPERHVEELGRRLAAMGHEVSVYVRPYYGQSAKEGGFLKEYLGMRLYTLPSIRTKHLDAISHSFLATVHAIPRGMDIVHFHAQGPSTVAWLSRAGRSRTVATVHGLDWQREKWGRLASAYLKLGEISSARWVDGTICVSRTMTEYYEKKYGIHPAYIPNGIRMPGEVGNAQIRAQWGLDRGGYYLFLARLVPEKGCHYLVQAFRRLKTDRRLVITGGGVYTDAYVQRLRELAGDDPRILFTGYQYGEVLEELYANAYLYILPSDLEGLPITLLEAMSHATPALVSDIPENLEVLDGAKDSTRGVGLTFPRGAEQGLEERLAWAEGHPEEIATMGRAGRDRVSSAYDWDQIAQQTADFYANIAG
ncbi:MAG: glycosyltransferase family 4 protein [Verrucomicrobiota bacterium]|nr:glycosyltransferase family 4 protein [Verrucomicrobiota bacterium]MDD8051564.1 glycosyltransferase family 4 protein [Verrucomicrobiota bacterium]